MRGPVWVIKLGGSLGPTGLEPLGRFLMATDHRLEVVVVHGGGPEITRALTVKGLPAVFREGLRVTSAEAAEVVREVLAEHVNTQVVESLQRFGVEAQGLAGDLGVLRGASLGPGWQQTGQVTEVRPDALRTCWAQHLVPVLAPTARDAKGALLNVNADDAAWMVAVAVAADALLFLTDVPYVMVPWDAVENGMEAVPLETGTAGIARMTHLGARSLLNKPGIIRAGMRPKLEAAQMAVSRGVSTVWIVNGTDPRYLLDVLEHPRTARGTAVVCGGHLA